MWDQDLKKVGCESSGANAAKDHTMIKPTAAADAKRTFLPRFVRSAFTVISTSIAVLNSTVRLLIVTVLAPGDD